VRFALALLLAAVLAGCSQDEPPAIRDSETSGLEREIQGFSLSETQDGKHLWDLHAETAWRIPNDDRIHLDNLTLTFYDTHQAPDSRLTAMHGTVDEKSGMMTARDRVVLISEAGDTLNTEELTYDKDRDRIAGPGYVRLAKPDQVVTGREFDAKPDLTDYEIRHDVNITVVDRDRLLNAGH